MSGREPPQAGWPGAIRLLHWISAVMIITMLTVGTIMVRVDDTGIRFDLYQSHKAFGIAVLSMTLVRLLTRLVLAPRGPAVPGPRWQSLAASAAHGALYVLIVAVALSGWTMASATPLPIPTSVFGMFDLPAIVPRDLETYKLAKTWHGWLTKALFAVALLHVAAALKHHFVDRDSVLSRMIRGGS
jgi:cytochrome b561